MSLQRFIDAQDKVYKDVLIQLKAGKKRTHWMWYIFPQFKGLGRTEQSNYYAIKSIQEAQNYLKNKILRERLLECSHILLELENRTAIKIFGTKDRKKLRSCMTLFASVDTQNQYPVFEQILEKYYSEETDLKTLNQLLYSLKSKKQQFYKVV